MTRLAFTRVRRSYSYAIVTVLFWSTVATAFKIALQHLDIYQLIFYSVLSSVTVLVGCFFVRNGVLPGARELWRVFSSHWRITLIAGALNPLIYYLILFAAYDRLPAQVAQPINYTWAIVLTFMSMLILKQAMTRQDLLAAFVCYAGVVIIIGQGGWSITAIPDLPGVALALLSTLIWASYWIINLHDDRDPLAALCLNFIVSLAPAFLLCSLLSDPFAITPMGAASAVYIGLFEMGLAFLCWSQALKLAENTSRVSNLIFLSPFLSLIFINQVLDEPIFITTYVGLLVIVTGLVIQRLRFN
ncbi:MAG: DMT family transporter [Pseudomonadales bacterium]